MRDLTTSISAFLVLAILLTGVYVAVQSYERVDRATAIALPDANEVEDVLNAILGGGEGPTPPPPPSVVFRKPSPTPTPSPTVPTEPASGTPAATPPTATPTLPPPPPTPAPPPTPTPGPTPTPLPRFPYVLSGTIRHDNACPGEYVIGVVRDARGTPLAGVTVRMEDEYGNGDSRVTKSGAGETGRYEFVLYGPPRRIYVWIVDEGGNAISPRVEIMHLLPNSGYEAFKCHYVDWTKVR